MNFAASKLHWFPLRIDPYYRILGKIPDYFIVLLVAAPALLIATIQSRRQFRREIPDGTLAKLRYIAAPALATFLVVFLFQLAHSFAAQSGQYLESAMVETHDNIRQLNLDLTTTDEKRPRRLSAQELAGVVTSENARLWLEGASLDVYSVSQHYFQNGVKHTLPIFRMAAHLPNGWTCVTTEWFNPGTGLRRTGPFGCWESTAIR